MPATYPTIRISTMQGDAGAQNSVSVEFEYLPESLSFATSSHFEKHPFPPFTAAQYLIYQYSTLEDVTVDAKVVAGCNNAIVNYGTSSGLLFGFATSKAAKTSRNELITIAQLLYSLTLPPTNSSGDLGVPPYCNLTIGPYCRCMGYVASVNIKYGGPYDWDGSPTEMDVSLTFTPTEWNALNNPKFEPNMTASQTMDGNTEATGTVPYAFWVGQNSDPIAPPAPPAKNPGNQGPELIGNAGSPSTAQILSAEGVQAQAQRDAGLAPGPASSQVVAQKSGTYTNANIAEAYGLPVDLNNPGQVNNQVRRYQINDPTTGQPTGPYFYDIAGQTHIPEATVNDNVARYAASHGGLYTPTTTIFDTTSQRFVGTGAPLPPGGG